MDTFLEKLNPPQREAVQHTEGPLIIFAGAGTGKTRVITYRIAHLLSKGVHPMSILAVTFTNKAAEEMRRRVDVLVPGQGRAVWISTFHSFGARFLRTEAQAIGLARDFLIYDSSDQKHVLRDCIKELNLDDKKFKPGRMIEIISRAKDDLLDADSYGIHALASGDYFRQTSATIYKLYQKKLQSAGALDFGDLLMLTVTSLRDNKQLLEKYQERFRYVLVDEYQDTNHAQYLLTKYFSAKHKNICVVGDDDQSIYSWRGADIRNILEFERDYNGCTTVKLEQNYRSSSTILSAAWYVVQNNRNRVDKRVWTDNTSGKPVRLVESANELEEAQRVVDEIEYLHKEGAYRYADCAVFYRTNAQSRVLEDAFRRSGINYAVIGSMRFYERQEVKDILAYLRLVHNPHDNVSFKRIINAPRRGIGKTSLEALEKFAIKSNLSLWDALGHLSSTDVASAGRKAFFGFKALLETLRRESAALTVKQIALSVIEKTGYLTALEAEDTPEAKTRVENIQELVSAIDEFEQRSPDTSLAGYLTQIALVSDSDDLPSTGTETPAEPEDRVTLMTLHLAKGLEFRAVFILGLEEGLFPMNDSSFSPDELEEERRLMYVGMTRAKEDLYLSWANERRVFGKSTWNMPSRFIEETRSCGNSETLPPSKTAPQPYRGATRHEVEFGDAAPAPDYESFGDLPRDPPDETERKPQDEPQRELSVESPRPGGNTLYALGSRVRHAQFGNGKVIDRTGSGDDLKLIVLFDTGQWKKLLVKYANLELL